MAAIFKNKKTGCGCGEPNTRYVEVSDSGNPPRILSHQCCKTVDLDEIYDQMVEYDEGNTPCEQCLGRGTYDIDCEFNDETPPKCVDCTATWLSYEQAVPHQYTTEESTSPHGHVFQDQEIPQCSKLVVFVNAKSDGSNLTYDEIKVYKSRKRRSLPTIREGIVFPNTPTQKLQCIGLPYCQAGNLERKCCCGKFKPFSDIPRTCFTYFENRGCEVAEIFERDDFDPPSEAECKNCSDPNFFENFNEDAGEFVKEPLYNHWMMSPCYFEATNWPSGTQEIKRNLMAYGNDDDNWWFLSSNEFNSVKQEIAEIDPMGNRPHTVLLHCEVRSRPIYCCTSSRDQNYDGVSVGCDGGVGDGFKKNQVAGFCGAGLGSFADFNKYNKKYLSNTEDREQQVKIYGAVGFTAACGKLDFDKICDDKWDEGEEYGV